MNNNDAKSNQPMLDSFMRNCYVARKPGDEVLFEIGNGAVRARLDGYAIIPMEVFEALSSKPGVNHLALQHVNAIRRIVNSLS